MKVSQHLWRVCEARSTHIACFRRRAGIFNSEETLPHPKTRLPNLTPVWKLVKVDQDSCISWEELDRSTYDQTALRVERKRVHYLVVFVLEVEDTGLRSLFPTQWMESTFGSVEGERNSCCCTETNNISV